MATITNQASLTYTYGTTTANVLSNPAQTVLNASLSAEKRVLEDAYRAGEELTYIVSLQNGGETAINGIQMTDDLGAFTPEGAAAPVVPLTYTGPAELFIDGVFSETLTPVLSDAGATFTIPALPAGSNALLLYKARVNEYAPLEADSEITNTVSVDASEPLTASATVPVNSYADVTIEKEMAPNPVTDGGTLTVTFTIENSGNTEATDLVLTDAFPVSLQNVAVTVNGAPVTDFTFENDTLTLPAAGSPKTTLTVPAATFTRSETTRAVTINPGVMTITVTGTI